MSSEIGPHVLRRRIADFVVEIRTNWRSAIPGLERAQALHEPSEAPADLIIDLGAGPSDRYDASPPGRRFESIYGRFLRARWTLDDVPHVHVAPIASPLRLIRPFVDLEGHPISFDAGRILNERVITTFVQLARTPHQTFVHAAAMSDAEGRGLMITGRGGVGKTSLALELGLHRDWSFIADDMVITDTTGRMHLNGTWPKIYAYNVVGDADLEQRVLDGRSLADRLHWLARRRWPSHVRREIDPVELYGATRSTAQLTWVLQIERADVTDIEVSAMTAEASADVSGLVLEEEVRKLTPDVAEFLRRADTDLLDRFRWGKDGWIPTLRTCFGSAAIHRIRVPHAMKAVPYRNAMVEIIDDLAVGVGSVGV